MYTRWRRLHGLRRRARTSLQPGDDLLQVAIDYITAHSPVDPVVEGRIVGP